MAKNTKSLSWIIGAVLVLGGAAVIAVRALHIAPDPEGEIIAQLKSTEEKGLKLPIPSLPGTLQSVRHRYDRITVSVDYANGTAVAVATLDFVGKLNNVDVSSLGWERVPFHRKEGAWLPESNCAPVLTGILKALAARQVALSAGDSNRLAELWAGTMEGQTFTPTEALSHYLDLRQRTYEVNGWVIRSEREEAIVAEDYRVGGNSPSVPVEERGNRRLTLVNKGGAFLFWPTLM